MNILIAAIHYPSASGRFIKRAFQRLGHDVKTVGPSTGNRIWGLEVQDRFVWQPDVVIKAAIQPENTEMGRVLDYLSDTGWEPDLIVTADSAYTLTGDAPCPHVLWGVDNHVRDYRIGAKSDWDWKFLAHRFAGRMDEENSVWLPCAYDPTLHVERVPFYQRQMFGAMVGVLYPPRMELLQTLTRGGMQGRIIAGMGPLFEEYAEIYNSAVASLCLSAASDVAQRVFEGLAMGCLVMTDACHDFEALELESGKQLVVYDSPADCLSKLTDLLNGDPQRLADIISAGKAWVEGHTWDARAQTVLETVFGDA